MHIIIGLPCLVFLFSLCGTGFGAAMVIESLGLYYHVQCFRCCVCHTTLGNGSQGADVRVRVNKLHCRNCYSNDEGNYLLVFENSIQIAILLKINKIYFVVCELFCKSFNTYFVLHFFVSMSNY